MCRRLRCAGSAASTNKKRRIERGSRFIEPALHSFAVGDGHRHVMRGLFSQIVIGIVVTVIGGLITDAMTGGHVSRHFGSPGFHSSSRGR